MSTTRRTIVGGSIAVLATARASVAAPAVSAAATTDPHAPDAALIALCVRFEALEAEYRRRCYANEDGCLDDPDGYDEALRAIGKTPATTTEGMKAKARALIAYYQPDWPESGAAGDAAWSLICDVAGVTP